MKVLKIEKTVNGDTFEPEFKLLISIGVESIIDNTSLLGVEMAKQKLGEEFVKEFISATESIQPITWGKPE
jgi:hypothetical protein